MKKKQKAAGNLTPGGINHTIWAPKSQKKNWQQCAAELGFDAGSFARRALVAATTGALHVEFTERQLPRGRPTSEREELVQFQVKLQPGASKEFKSCAKAQGLNVGEWERQVIDAACKAKDKSFLVS